MSKQLGNVHLKPRRRDIRCHYPGAASVSEMKFSMICFLYIHFPALYFFYL